MNKILIGNKLDLIEGKICKPLDEQSWSLVQEKMMQHIEVSCKSESGCNSLWEKMEQRFFVKKSRPVLNPEKGMKDLVSLQPKKKKPKKREETEPCC